MASVLGGGALAVTATLVKVIIPAAVNAAHALSRVDIPKEANWAAKTKLDKQGPTLTNTYRFNANSTQSIDNVVSSNNNIVSENNPSTSNNLGLNNNTSSNRNRFLNTTAQPINTRTNETPVVAPGPKGPSKTGK